MVELIGCGTRAVHLKVLYLCQTLLVLFLLHYQCLNMKSPREKKVVNTSSLAPVYCQVLVVFHSELITLFHLSV